MAKPGPSPVPTRILELRGSTVLKRKGTARPNEPQLPTERPVMPTFLGMEAQAIWKKVVPQLHSAGLLARVDGWMLARYCVLWVEWQHAGSWLTDYGQTVVTLDPRTNGPLQAELWPQARLLMTIAAELRRIEQHFGMSPSARASLGQVSQEKQADVTPGKDPERFFRRA